MRVDGRPPAAVVGMAVLLPGAPDLAAYWRNLVEGVDAITDVPEGRWDADYYDPAAAAGPASADRLYCRRGGFVDALAEVQPTRFGLMPSSVPGTEPDQLIALQVAAEAIADAGGADRLPDRDRVGVVLGRGGYLTPGLARLDQRVRGAHQLVRTLGELIPELTPGQLDRVRAAFTERLGPVRPESAIGLVPNLAASRLANRLDLRGPAYTVDAACASSLVAVDQAVGELASGRCDLVLAGGVHHCHDVTLWSVFAQLRALSPSQRIRPFHRGADGILIGEGTGVVVLKRLADAERDGDRIYAVIRGTGVASDGRTAGLAAPDPGGQSRAVRAAWQAAGLDPSAPGSIGLLEAHGTATPAGDTAELATLAEVFGPTPAGGGRAVLGSVKSMIGHTMPAAGVAGLVKAALAVHHGMLLPTLHCEDPHPALAATRFRTVDTARPWETVNRPRRAAVNAFGFGGINAHVVLEQAPGGGSAPPPPPGPVRRTSASGGRGDSQGIGAPLDRSVRGHLGDRPSVQGQPAPSGDALAAPRAPAEEPDRPQGAGPTGSAGPTPATVTVTEPERVLRLAADGPEQLAALLTEDDRVVLAAGLPDRAVPAPRCRLAIVDPTPKRLALARRAVARGRAWRGRGDVWFAPEPLLGEEAKALGRVAFLFPGLESEFAPRVDDVAEHFALPLPDLAAGGAMGSDPAGGIGRHGVGVVGVGRLLDAALRRMGIGPDAVAGHSVGEWTAMIAGGLFSGAEVDSFLSSFDPDALRVPGLAFAALGASAERVLEALATVDGLAEIVLSHDNAPQQSIVCGPEEPVGRLVRWFRARGVLGQVLPFRSGFHTPMLSPYLEPIRQSAERFTLHPAGIPVWSGTTAAPFPAGQDGIRALFVRHLLETVRFRPLVEALYADGFRAFVQVGTGQLGSLVGDTLHGRDHLVVAANVPHRPGISQLRCVAAALWSIGAEPDPAVLRAQARAGASAAARSHPAVPLDLSGALVSLDTATLGSLRAELARSRGAVPTPAGPPAPPAAPMPAGPAADLTALADRFPLAGELDALLRDTARTAADLITAARHAGRAAPPPPSLTSAPPFRASTPPSGLSAPPNHAYASPPAPARPVGGRHTSRLRVCTLTMPYLLDHCFFQQRPGWPDVADRWPVVPATTIVQHLMDAAERARPGQVAVAVHDLRFGQWVPAAEPLDVEITLQELGPDRLTGNFGEYAQGTVELTDSHSGSPEPWPIDPADERRPELTAAGLYQERWMFHGPAFQGLTELTAIGDTHVRGVITAPAAPGALLDNVGQLLGYWIMATRTERTVVFPVGMRRLRWYGPPPPPGTELDCRIRITALSDTILEADAQLVSEGAVLAEVSGWQDRRFDSDPITRPVERRPGHNTLSTAQPGGWTLLHEHWPDLASRDLIMRNHLGSAERERYHRQPPRGRRGWLLGRIAVKDAVRRWLWDHGEGPVFPAEIQVWNEASGRPRVTGAHGRALPALDVSLAHSAEAAVALVREAGEGSGGVGIDLEEVTDSAPRDLRVALGPAELDLLAACRAADPDAGSEALWFTRFWAAKEAVAKAEGTGLRGRPREFAIVSAGPGTLLVRVAGPDGPRTHRVHHAETGNLPGLPERRYVVAWTVADTPQPPTGATK
ncbi:beta-ketoacyl synthase N-terminal-like domain-containing protein [Kitasatospora sp. HPMI-4]|uniref:beta-ketoacyl synthase N-terminal-like domain-containing protein n=1 Tax=Kitasatospora sp. HPMI-4 TaxID=3448443 RepID=UPI003F1A8B28